MVLGIRKKYKEEKIPGFSGREKTVSKATLEILWGHFRSSPVRAGVLLAFTGQGQYIQSNTQSRATLCRVVPYPAQISNILMHLSVGFY